MELGRTLIARFKSQPAATVQDRFELRLLAIESARSRKPKWQLFTNLRSALEV